MSRPLIVCLCGSTRFMEEFYDANMRETLRGKIVLTVGMSASSSSSNNSFSGDLTDGEKQKIKKMLDELHRKKIEMADEILVISRDGYIGPSTRGEIAYASRQNKLIRFYEGEYEQKYT